MKPGSPEQRYFAASELAGLPGLPSTARGILIKAERERWESRRRKVGKGLEYAFTSLPAATQAALLIEHVPAPAGALTKHSSDKGVSRNTLIAAAWDRYETATDKARAEAMQAALQLDAVAMLVQRGMAKCEARHQVAAAMRAQNLKGGSAPTLARWERAVANTERADWPALLLPEYTGRTATAEIDSVLWDFFKGLYLARNKPSINSVYRRTAELAKAQGKPMPCVKTFARRIDSDVNSLAQTLMREGPNGLRNRLPRTDRDATVFTAGQAVNGDGLKFDRLWVVFPDGEVTNAATAWFWQDIRTRKILAWRLAKTEHTDTFRLATYDLTGVCAPEYVYLDNTRVAANKLMTGSAKGRHRFKSDPEDGMGLLLMCGMEPHFTNPDHETGNPGAKPIERAFGIGGLHHEVATNPRITAIGAYSPATAVPSDLLQEVIAQEVARHNSRDKRRTQVCRGVLSFDQAWAESVSKHPVRVLSDAQRRILLMSREVVTIGKTALITLEAGQSRYGRNRYWSDAAPNLIGQKVSVHFDPNDLSAGVHVYSLDGRYLFAAEHVAATTYNNTADSGQAKRLTTRVNKAAKVMAKHEERLNKHEREKLYATVEPAPAEVPTLPPNVLVPVFQRPIDPARDATRPHPGSGDVVPMRRTGTDDARGFDLDRHLKALQDRQIEAIGWTPPEQNR